MDGEVPEVERIARRIRRIFAGVASSAYFGGAERAEFAHFEGILLEALAKIAAKARSGRLRLLDLSYFPQCLRYPGYQARVAVFIGSFDPFQMTHLALALRFLAEEDSEADLVLVVPEGADNPLKPRKTDYRFRYDIARRQLDGIFNPLVAPLDLGEGADTIEIVRRLIALHPGAALRLTHLLGSDALPTAVRLLPEDLAAWREAAARHRVALDFGIHVQRREGAPVPDALLAEARRLGVRAETSDESLVTPSSSDFRSRGALTVAFPAPALLARLELLFRYGMQRPWMEAAAGAALDPAEPSQAPGGPGRTPDEPPRITADYEI
ncbi:MAG: hypothetical protein JNG85_16860 [Spirochaetaceae bacterium]|nr:hypothetical protein [Spirochaetaceae bacterium]